MHLQRLLQKEIGSVKVVKTILGGKDYKPQKQGFIKALVGGMLAKGKI